MPYQHLKFRYRRYLTIIQYYADGRCVARTLHTNGEVHYVADFYSVVMLDVICKRIDNWIEDSYV